MGLDEIVECLDAFIIVDLILIILLILAFLIKAIMEFFIKLTNFINPNLRKTFICSLLILGIIALYLVCVKYGLIFVLTRI